MSYNTTKSTLYALLMSTTFVSFTTAMEITTEDRKLIEQEAALQQETALQNITRTLEKARTELASADLNTINNKVIKQLETAADLLTKQIQLHTNKLQVNAVIDEATTNSSSSSATTNQHNDKALTTLNDFLTNFTEEFNTLKQTINTLKTESSDAESFQETAEKTINSLGILALAYAHIPLIDALDIPLYAYGVYKLYQTYKNSLPSKQDLLKAYTTMQSTYTSMHSQYAIILQTLHDIDNRFSVTERIQQLSKAMTKFQLIHWPEYFIDNEEI